MSLDGSKSYVNEISSAVKLYHGTNVKSNGNSTIKSKSKKSSLSNDSSLENKLLSEDYKDEDKSEVKSDDLENFDDTLDLEEFFRMEKEFIEQSMLYSQQQESIYSNQPNPNEMYQLEQEEEKYAANSNSETMEDPEAQEAVEQIVTEAVLGGQNLDRLSLEDRRRFSNWQKFNKALLMLYHNTSTMVTSEVDYR